MISWFLIFSCIVILAAGTLLAWFVSSDEFEGCWVSIGVMDGRRLIPFPMGTISHELRFTDGNVEYMINGDHVPVTRSGRILQAELAAQICIDYKLSIREGRLIMTDPRGMQTVFEKVEEEPEGQERK